MFKKIVMFSIMLCVFAGMSVYADSPALRVSGVSGKVGETVSVDVSISGNPGIAMFDLKLEYNNTSLTPISIEKGVALAAGEITSNLQTPRTDMEHVSALWYNLTNISEDGVLFSVKFRINDGANGHIPINVSYKAGDICNQALEVIFLDVFSGGIDIVSTSVQGGPSWGGGYTGVTIPTPTQAQDKTIEQQEPIVEKEESQFNDISNYPWAAKEIEALFKKGIIKGTSEDTFSPDSNIKRADFLLMLVRMLNLTADFSDNFDDVSEDSYYYNEIGVARATGITEGIGENKFDPEAFIKRQDMFVLAYRILKDLGKIAQSNEDVLAQFHDAHNISGYAKEALGALVAEGYVKGNENRIEPMEFTTRAETAVFVYRISE